MKILLSWPYNVNDTNKSFNLQDRIPLEQSRNGYRNANYRYRDAPQVWQSRIELSQIPIVHAAQDFWKPWWSGNYSWRWPCKSKGPASKPSRSLKAVHNVRFWFRFPRVPLGLEVFRYFPYWRGWSKRFAFTSFGLRTLSWEELRMCSQYWGNRYFGMWFRNSWGLKLPCKLYSAKSRLTRIYSLERWMRVLCRRRR